jgi:hypothetical protein
MFPFGAGRLFLQPSGSLGYFRLGVAAMQEGSWAIDVDVKELHGANRFPVDIRTGIGRIEGGAKYADWDPDAIAAILGVSTSAGVTLAAINESHAVPATPFQVTVDESATFDRNLEVVYADTGLALEQVAPASEATGKYSVTAGVYTFVTGDKDKVLLFSYTYTDTSGKKVEFNNVPIGTTPVMKGLFQGISDAKQMVLELDQVVPYGLRWASRLDDWSMLDNNMKAFANPTTGVIGKIHILS